MAKVSPRILPSGRRVFIAGWKDQEGKRRFKQFDLKRDADDHLLTVGIQVRDGTHIPDSKSITVAEAGALWLKWCASEGLEASTVEGYETHLRLHIAPFIGRTKLTKLTTPACQAFADDLLETRSRAMVRKVVTSLKTLIGDAQRRGLIGHNPAEPVKLKKRRTESEEGDDVEIPSKDDIRSLLTALTRLDNVASGQRYQAFILTALFTGLRTSELRGLQWREHVDLDAGRLLVRQRVDKFGQLGPPKSKAGRREVPIAPMAINALRRWKLICPPSDQGLVFPSLKGGIWAHIHVLRSCFYPLLASAGLARKDDAGNIVDRAITFHTLRHIAASLFIEQGWQAKRIQKVMGHSSIQVTYDVYGHLFPTDDDDQEDVAAIQARLIEG